MMFSNYYHAKRPSSAWGRVFKVPGATIRPLEGYHQCTEGWSVHSRSIMWALIMLLQEVGFNVCKEATGEVI